MTAIRSGQRGAEHRYTEIADWFEMEEVLPRIYRIVERYYRADYRCNIYLVKGMVRDIIVDAGLGLASLVDYVRPYARNPLLVLSHAHYDHIGSAFEFPERMIHSAEADLLAEPTRANTYADLLLSADDFSRLPWPSFDAARWIPEPAPATSTLAHGDVIDLGDRAFEVMSTPGHSPGSICLWDVRNRIVLSADTVYSGELFDHLSCSDIPTYVETMDALRLLPVDVALPGHGPVLSGSEFRAIALGYVAGKRCNAH